MSIARKSLVMSLTAVVIVVAVLGALSHFRGEKYTAFQLVSLARALAAYMSQSEGLLPDCPESLVRVGLLRQVRPGYYEVLDAPMVPEFRVLPMGPSGIKVATSQFEVAWSGQAAPASGLLIASKEYRDSLNSLSSHLTEQLRQVAHARRAEKEAKEGK